MRRWSAIFFDFDGVLAESADIKTEAFIDLYSAYGPAVVARVLDHHARHAGISRLVKIRDCHKAFLGIDLDPGEHARLGALYAAIVKEKVVICPWVPGAREVVEALSGRIPLFIVSGTPEEELLEVVARRGMAAYFDEVRGSPALKPEIIEDLIRTHGVDRGGALMVGDAPTDYHAARDTGIAFLGRVPAGRPNPFPPGTEVAPDLTGLAESL